MNKTSKDEYAIVFYNPINKQYEIVYVPLAESEYHAKHMARRTLGCSHITYAAKLVYKGKEAQIARNWAARKTEPIKSMSSLEMFLERIRP